MHGRWQVFWRKSSPGCLTLGSQSCTLPNEMVKVREGIWVFASLAVGVGRDIIRVKFTLPGQLEAIDVMRPDRFTCPNASKQDHLVLTSHVFGYWELFWGPRVVELAFSDPTDEANSVDWVVHVGFVFGKLVIVGQ